MNTEELAAFNKIMGEIEGAEEEPTSGPGKSNQALSQEETELDADSESDDDFSAELEKVVQEADGTDSTPAAEAQADDSADGLDEDQQKAFESIMAQIEGGDDSDDDAASDEEAAVDQDSESDNDFSAELEKVVQETDGTDSTPAAEAQADDSADGLDEDQQKAFESIMAQIEGGDDSDDDAASDEEAAVDQDSESDDDFSAELEKVVQSDDTAESNEAEESSPADSEDAIDAEQQQAFERIIDQIGKGDEEDVASDKENETPSDSLLEVAVEAPEEKATASSNDGMDEDTQDISGDIDDLLKEITSENEGSQIPETSAEEADAVSNESDQTAEVIVSTDRVDHHQEDSSDPEPKSVNPGPGDESEQPVEPEKTLLQEDPSVLDSTEAGPPPGSPPAHSTAKPLPEATSSAGKSRFKIFAAFGIVIFFIAIGAYSYWPFGSIFEPQTALPLTDDSRSDIAVDPQPNLQPQAEEPVIVAQPPSDRSRLKTVVEQLDHMRNELIAKQTEIEELRAYYQAGIDAEIQGILNTVSKAGRGNISYKTALANPRIRLGLSAIQRRDSYIRKLVSPTNVLLWNSEELLFFSRKAGLLALMTEKTSDIDIDGFIDQVDRIRERHGRALAELNIDAVSVSPLALKTIWQDIAKRLPSQSAGIQNRSGAAKADATTLSKKICRGDYTNRHQLTVLSPETARCLAQWKGKDLFLNELTELQPETARQLAAWEGEWLGLNGLEELSPESAIHLARWEGKGLSLNGLSRLSPRVVAILSEWQGEQIELINVKHMAHWENPNTRLFLSEDLNRKLNNTRK